jgi:hypothetical protein
LDRTFVLVGLFVSSIVLSGCSPVIGGGLLPQVGCTPGAIPVGTTTSVTLAKGVTARLVGGRCFDEWEVLDGPDALSPETTKALKSVKSKFCEAMGIEDDLNRVLGHGVLFVSDITNPYASDASSGSLSGQCQYTVSFESAKGMGDADTSIEGLTISWAFDGGSPFYEQSVKAGTTFFKSKPKITEGEKFVAGQWTIKNGLESSLVGNFEVPSGQVTTFAAYSFSASQKSRAEAVAPQLIAFATKAAAVGGKLAKKWITEHAGD